MRERITVTHFVPSMLRVFLERTGGGCVYGAAGGVLQR